MCEVAVRTRYPNLGLTWIGTKSPGLIEWQLTPNKYSHNAQGLSKVQNIIYVDQIENNFY